MEDKNNTQLKLLDFLSLFVQGKWFIFFFTLFGTLLFLGISFLLPKEYITMAAVKSSGSSSFNMSSLLKSSGLGSGLGAFMDIAGPSGGGNIDYLASIVTSRTVLDSMIYEFKLKERYDFDEIEFTRKELLANLVLETDYPSDVLKFGVYDEVPEDAARMTNQLIYYLNMLYSRLDTDAGRNNRLNLEQRYNEIMYDLKIAEDSLTKFQKEYGVLDPYVQTEASLRTASAIKTELMLKEIEADTKMRLLGENSPEAVLYKEQIKLLKERYNEFLTGLDKGEPKDFFIPFNKTPDLAMNYYKLYRRVEINGELLKVIIPLIEQAKIQELRETSSLLVIDEGVVPEYKSKPKRAVFILIGFGLFLMLSLIYVFIKGSLQEMERNNPSAYRKVQSIVSDLRFKKKK